MDTEALVARATRRRVFWLGMHHVLKPTELRRLRGLGFEVFNPAYLSSVFDQSADWSIDLEQDSTLPPDVFRALIAHNFFYTSVPPHIAAILNAYFDTVIVTIHPDWLLSILKVYRGRIIYRIYGQPRSLSAQLVDNGAYGQIVGRSDMVIVPFAPESVETEQTWFLDRCEHFVPYQIPDDVFGVSQTWGTGRLRTEIAVNIPNIQNPYYERVYDAFKIYDEAYFRILGPQRAIPPDPRILGKLQRPVFLSRLAESAALFYPYTDNVCYLAPIEMMEIGGPVVYAAGSLLARFGEPNAPGLAATAEDAKDKLRRLLERDKEFADEIVASQEPIRLRYDRDNVGPIFDRVFRELIGAAEPRRAEGTPCIETEASGTIAARTIVVPLHHDSLLPDIYGPTEGSHRVASAIVVMIDAILANTDLRVLVSCRPDATSGVREIFSQHARSDRLDIHPLEVTADHGDSNIGVARLDFLALINRSGTNVVSVLIPHQSLFPECLLLTRPSILCVSDVFQYQTRGLVDGSPDADRIDTTIGLGLARRAEKILTHSRVTKGQLAITGMIEEDQSDKVVVVPIPLRGRSRAEPLSQSEEQDLRRQVGEGRFLFYPTADRPNKNLPFLLRLLAHMRLSFADLRLVLTSDLDDVNLRNAAKRYGVLGEIVVRKTPSDGAVRWLYENTAALCLTSLAEDIFPHQVLDALRYRAPIVTTRLPAIVEAARSEVEHLLTCGPSDLAEFADAVSAAIVSRDHVLRTQDMFSAWIVSGNSEDDFARRISSLFRQ